MSEWPQDVGIGKKGQIVDDYAALDTIAVIPADLGRELYKALRAEFDDDKKEWREESAIALDRYKRLVGE